MRTKTPYLVVLTLALAATATWASVDSGSDGSDGVFHPTSNIEIDLGLAATATWDTPSPVPGQGVYDPEKWVIVFKYTTIDIPAGVSVTFKNHRSGAPVVWLAQGDVTIHGAVSLDGENGYAPGDEPRYSEPGPGGFGGAMLRNAGGFGPWGGDPNGSTVHGSFNYTNPNLMPLIGGSGGGTNHYLAGGGAGGGAILIASNQTIDLSAPGFVRSWGGARGYESGDASGGAIRLVANTVRGNGSLTGGAIRIEAWLDFFVGPSSFPHSTGLPTAVLPPSSVPALRVAAVDGVPVPEDPDMGILTPEVSIEDAGPVLLEIEGRNVPVGVSVTVRVVPEHGAPIDAFSTPLADAGNGVRTATAVVTFPPGAAEVQLRAAWNP